MLRTEEIIAFLAKEVQYQSLWLVSNLTLCDGDEMSWKDLEILAKNPVDLTVALTPERIKTFVAENLGIKLFYGTEKVSEPVLEALFALAKERKVLSQMGDMQTGKIVNIGEKRPALHTAMRDLFSKTPKAPEATRLAKAELEKLKNFLPRLDPFTDLIQVGIGGSSLGPEAICLALEAYNHPNRRVHFLSNVDPDEAAKIVRRVDLAKTVVVVVSKSGTTLETLTNEALLRNQFVRLKLNPKDHIIAVTGKGSPMDDPSRYLASFYMWDYIGGRYSVTSMVGAVALAFALGFDPLMEFLKGAHAMDEVSLEVDPHKNLPLLSALLGIWNRNFLGHATVAIIPYSQALGRFPAHLQQLGMESNGKRVDLNGKALNFETCPILWGEPGTNGQHSFFQLLHQGTTTVPVEIIGFVENQYGEDLEVSGTNSQQKLLSNLFAQSIAFAKGEKNDNPTKFFPGNRPNQVLLLSHLDPYTMGCLLSYYEHRVAFQGFIWGINSFDQEGVQLGKRLASKMIDQFKGAKDYPLGQAFIKLLSKSNF